MPTIEAPRTGAFEQSSLTSLTSTRGISKLWGSENPPSYPVGSIVLVRT